ncbi:hypothetical protein V1226_22615 [Lachnospiraceae bacterium JLR.KK009]
MPRYKMEMGVSGLWMHEDGRVIGYEWTNDADYIDALNTERYRYKELMRDKAEAYYTSVLREFAPIPEFKGENDVEKGILWNRIAAAGCKIRWFNKKIYACEYLADGMSKNIIKIIQKIIMAIRFMKESIFTWQLVGRKKQGPH